MPSAPFSSTTADAPAVLIVLGTTHNWISRTDGDRNEPAPLVLPPGKLHTSGEFAAVVCAHLRLASLDAYRVILCTDQNETLMMRALFDLLCCRSVALVREAAAVRVAVSPAPVPLIVFGDNIPDIRNMGLLGRADVARYGYLHISDKNDSIAGLEGYRRIRPRFAEIYLAWIGCVILSRCKKEQGSVYVTLIEAGDWNRHGIRLIPDELSVSI